MSTAVVDFRTPKKCIEALLALEFSIITLPSFSALQEPVSAHPDMLLFFADKTVFCHKDYFAAAKDELESIRTQGYEIALSNEKISSEYPEDILFNALRLGDTIYCRADRISNLILEYAEKKGINIVGVKQGYAKCSVCAVGDNAAITADEGLCKAMRNNGVDVLLISAGNIILSGYDTGFIGGCSGTDGEKIYFSGNIALHPDGDRIAEFCLKHKKEPVSLSDELLYDIGSIFFIQ